MASFGEVIPIAEDRTVDIACVEQELRRLWQDSAGELAEPTLTRVCSLNLVALAPDARSAARASEAGTAITGRYPCRVLIATVDSGGCDGLEASISAYCHPGAAGDRPLCCERITLCASGEAVRQLPWSITSLLSPEVPVFLWAPGDIDLEGPLFKRLAGVADRVVVDLQAAPRPGRLLRQLMTLPKRPAVTDMAWRRTSGWRELVASLFDPQAVRPYLSSLCGLQVEYVAGGAGWDAAQAASLGAWVCERLGWTPEGKLTVQGGNSVLKVKSGNREGTITLSGVAHAGTPPGEIIAVVFPCGEGCDVHLELRRTASGDLAEAQVRRPDTPPFSWQRPLPPHDTTWLLGQEIERPHGSAAFEGMLPVLAGIVEELHPAPIDGRSPIDR